MGRIVTSAEVHNIAEPRKGRRIDFLVDTGASHVVPAAWKEQFGDFELERETEAELAGQGVTTGTICGPARIRIEGFRAVHGDIVFLEMESESGKYEPLLGYLPLQQCGAAVDMLGHRLVPVRHLDMKAARPRNHRLRRPPGRAA